MKYDTMEYLLMKEHKKTHEYVFQKFYLVLYHHRIVYMDGLCILSDCNSYYIANVGYNSSSVLFNCDTYVYYVFIH